MAFLLRRLLADETHDANQDGWTGNDFLYDSDAELTDLQIIAYVSVAICLILMAGLMSGLTLGLMSLDTVELEVLKRSGTPEEKRCADIIMPVIKNQHFLLVTLLLCNAASTEALPLFIDRLADPVTAVLVSVSSVLVFGEIIPQAICTRYGLKVGAYSAWFVRGLMFVCSPLAWPVGRLLDFLLGSEHSALFRRAQLKALVDVHSSSAGFGGTLSEQEIAVIRGALDLTSKTAAKSMTPMDKVFMLSSEDRLDERTMQAILLSGHSRIPVYREGNRKDIMGLILSKELVLIDPADNLAVSQLKVRPLPHLSADTPMYDMLKLFETGKSHMALLIKGHCTHAPASTGDKDKADAQGDGKTGKNGKNGKNGKGKGGNGRNGSHYSALASHDYDDRHPTGVITPHDSTPLPLNPGGPTELAAGEGEPIGIITIEDVIEELLQEEIIDETDIFVDNLQAQRVNAAEVSGALPPRLQNMLSTGQFTPRVGRLGAPQRFMSPPGMTDDVSAHRHVELKSGEHDTTDGPLYAEGSIPAVPPPHHTSNIPLLPVSHMSSSSGPGTPRQTARGDGNEAAPATSVQGSRSPGWLPRLAGRSTGGKDGSKPKDSRAAAAAPDLETGRPLLRQSSGGDQESSSARLS